MAASADAYGGWLCTTTVGVGPSAVQLGVDVHRRGDVPGRRRRTAPSASMVRRSRARTSPHHRPHGLTRKSSPDWHVMWPVRFSHQPTSSRWRSAIASSCAGVSSTPGPGTARGAHAASPPVARFAPAYAPPEPTNVPPEPRTVIGLPFRHAREHAAVPDQRRRQSLQRAATTASSATSTRRRSTSRSGTVRAPDGKRMQLFAGQPSKFHSDQVTFSKEELEKMLGDTSNVGTGRGTVPHEEGEPELGVVPGMLLNRLNPLKGLSDEERKAFVAEFRNKSEAFGDRDLRLALMDEQGIDKALMFPAAAHDIEYEFADNIDALYANIRAFNRWMHEEVGFVVDEPDVAAALHLVRRPRPRGQGARDRHGAGRDRDPDEVGPRARRRRQPVRRPFARRSRLRPVLEHRERRRHAARRAPRRHRLPEVRRRLVGGSRDRLRRLRRVPVDDVLG